MMGNGIGGAYVSQHAIEVDREGPPARVAAAKPPYRVPRMAEVAAIPRNGLTVASTFAGCGGSCLGYRMAGFRVLWANEFVARARESYAANAPETILDGRDVREVSADDVLRATGLARGEIDLLDGSPPCSAYSSAGKRAKLWGRVKRYHEHAQRDDDLFPEYLRLLDGLRPRAFVCENVAGLVRGAAKGCFKDVLRRMRAIGYRVAARVLDAQWLGVPQSRARVIFVGAREDIGVEPAHPRPLPYRYSVKDACPWIDAVVGESKDEAALDAFRRLHPDGIPRECSIDGVNPNCSFNRADARAGEPSPTIMALGGAAHKLHVVIEARRRKFTIPELRRICSFPDDFVLVGSYAEQWERLGLSVPPLMMRAVAEVVRDRILLPARRAAGSGRPA